MTPVAEAIAEAGHGQAVVMAVRKEDLVTSTACVKVREGLGGGPMAAGGVLWSCRTVVRCK